MTRIHPTSIVDPRAELASDVEIGPYSVVEADVTIAAGCRLGPHVHVQGTTVIGRGTTVGAGTVLGAPPQHVAYDGTPRRLEIGRDNVIREHSSIHGSFVDGGATRLGDGCFVMAQAHIGHDTVVDDGAVISTGALISGHCHIGAGAIISGPVGIHQFVRVGRLAMVGGLSRVVQDIPPFVVAEGHPTRIRALNVVGLRRAGVGADERSELKRVFRELYRGDLPLRAALTQLSGRAPGPLAHELLSFYRGPSERGYTSFAVYGSKPDAGDTP